MRYDLVLYESNGQIILECSDVLTGLDEEFELTAEGKALNTAGEEVNLPSALRDLYDQLYAADYEQD